MVTKNFATLLTPLNFDKIYAYGQRVGLDVSEFSEELFENAQAGKETYVHLRISNEAGEWSIAMTAKSAPDFFEEWQFDNGAIHAVDDVIFESCRPH